ncbi:MAG: hypothetical protein BWY21_02068 [Parcubacteria group bacterium ADurb.Bin216]|nr:MAG: hypothetical protein BWY21_02068 [Parcubacteria group bacterium ADurb.Bin216]
MKKLILILLLFFISPVQASIISDLRIHNLTSDQMKQECPIENAIRCADIHSNIYIDKEYSDKNNVYQYVLFHEIGHHLYAPFRTDWENYEQEEIICDGFALWVVTGIDLGGGLFQKMVLNGYAEEK